MFVFEMKKGVSDIEIGCTFLLNVYIIYIKKGIFNSVFLLFYIGAFSFIDYQVRTDFWKFIMFKKHFTK